VGESVQLPRGGRELGLANENSGAPGVRRACSPWRGGNARPLLESRGPAWIRTRDRRIMSAIRAVSANSLCVRHLCRTSLSRRQISLFCMVMGVAPRWAGMS